jgi:putative hydrolase
MSTDSLKYRVKFDYHTHTRYSHGKGAIEDNIKAALNKGLSGIAVSDHGPGHLLYGIDRAKILEARDEIERLKKIYAGIEIFFSVEANILNTGKCLDLNENEIEDFDFIIAGYHYGVKNGYCIKNFMYNYCPVKLPCGVKMKNKNTDMAIKAIYENPVKILTHPGDKAPLDILEIAKACADRGTYLEINNHHGYINAEDIRTAAVTDVQFIVSSDAHRPEMTGVCDRSIKIALEAGLDMSRIANIEKR